MSNGIKVHLTQEGFNELQAEVNELKAKLPQAVDRVAKAREHGDLSENSEYHAAREDLSFVQGRVEELEEVLGHATIIKNSSGDSVSLGSQVTVLTHDNNEITFTIVGEYEADPHKKKISHDSPLGKALFGKKVTEHVEYEAPVGKIIYKIKKIN